MGGNKGLATQEKKLLTQVTRLGKVRVKHKTSKQEDRVQGECVCECVCVCVYLVVVL